MNTLFVLIILQDFLLFVQNSEYRLFYNDNIFNDDDISYYEIIYPKLFHKSKRTRRDLTNNLFYEYEDRKKYIKFNNNWLLELQTENNLIVPKNVKVQWINDKITTDTLISNCEYTSGTLLDVENSFSALTICNNDINGYFNVDNEIYFVQPLLNSTKNEHILYQNSLNRKKRSIYFYDNNANNNVQNVKKWEYFNLTGDVIDIGTNHIPEDIQQQQINITSNSNDTANKVNKPRILYREQFHSDDEIGYFYDSAWETNTYSGKFFFFRKNLFIFC